MILASTQRKHPMKKSALVDQNKIKIICDQLCDKIDVLLSHLNLEYRHNNRFVSMRCPIHGGDNEGALNIYHTGESYRGNWKCRTHHCEKVFKGSMIGFLRGVLSRDLHNWQQDGDDTCSFVDAMNFATKFLDIDIKDIKVCERSQEKSRFVCNAKLFNNTIDTNSKLLTRSNVRKYLTSSSPYFLNRGFKADILDKYDVGECQTANKEMFQRSVVPIYNTEHTHMVGCSGRSIFEKCDKCKSFHNPELSCPSPEEMYKYSKWRHSSGFKTQESLYNLWFAKEHILQTRCVVLVESPGNIWALEQAGVHNGVAIFGSSLTDRQKTILDTSGAMTIITIMDSDDAGEKGRMMIEEKCSRTYNIKHIRLLKNDIAEMSKQEIDEEIIKVLAKIQS